MPTTLTTSMPLVHPVPINGLECFGHSYFQNSINGTNPQGGNYIVQWSDDYSMQFLAARALGIPKENVINHGRNGAVLTEAGWQQGGYAKALNEIRKPTPLPPYGRTGGCYLFHWGVNDVGFAATGMAQTLLQTVCTNTYTTLISRCRASQVFLCANSAQWAHGTNFSNSALSAADFTSGFAIQATAVDSSGTSTATFTIPSGYQGEPICFNLVGFNGTTNTLIVTWGGTITGTTGIVGLTTNLQNTATPNFGAGATAAAAPVPVRFTAATNGLSAANAGQTINLKITTISGATCYVDGCWIESFKPSPVIVCNMPQLPCRQITMSFGDGVTNGTTTFTSNVANFLSGTDVNGSIVELDSQNAIQSGTTISAVGSTTSITLSKTANNSSTSIKYSIQRTLNGYACGYYGANTDFSGATPANHVAAQADVAGWNTAIANAVAQFGSMVQVADFDAALFHGETDASFPTNIYTYFAWDGLHPNNLGYQRCAQAIVQAALSLCEEAIDRQPMGSCETSVSPIPFVLADRRPIVKTSVNTSSPQIYLPEYTSWAGTPYTCVAGDMFAMPIFITDTTVFCTSVYLFQTNAPATAGSNVRMAIYDDLSFTGYPKTFAASNEYTGGGAVALGTTSGMKTINSSTNTIGPPGLYWIVLKVDSLGTTASTIQAITGPNKYLPNWLIAGTTTTPIAWKVTGLSAGAMPATFPAGGTLVSTAPAVGLALTVQ